MAGIQHANAMMSDAMNTDIPRMFFRVCGCSGNLVGVTMRSGSSGTFFDDVASLLLWSVSVRGVGRVSAAETAARSSQSSSLGAIILITLFLHRTGKDHSESSQC